MRNAPENCRGLAHPDLFSVKFIWPAQVGVPVQENDPWKLPPNPSTPEIVPLNRAALVTSADAGTKHPNPATASATPARAPIDAMSLTGSSCKNGVPECPGFVK